MDLSKLKGKLPDNIYTEFINESEKYYCTTPLRVAHFLSNCKHESQNFTRFYENLNYSIDGLTGTFEHYFTSRKILLELRNEFSSETNAVKKAALDTKLKIEQQKALAEDFERQPQKIANHVYANRNGNGDEASGDGWSFRGRGGLQTTGRENYKELQEYIGGDVNLIYNPDLVATKYPVVSGLYYFVKNNLYRHCDKGSDLETVKQVRHDVNGGLLGIADVYTDFNVFYKLLIS